MTITTSKIMKYDDKCFAVMFVDSLATCWYYTPDQFSVPLGTLLTTNNMSIPPVIANLDDHKLRVKYSLSDEKVIRKTSNYPETRWASVIPLNLVNPQQDLQNQLKTFTKFFKQALTPKEHMTPGRRFVTYCGNSGKDNILSGCAKYMGNTENIEKQCNNELIKLGKKDHIYVNGVTLDTFWCDHSIKTFLVDFLGCSSWEDVTDEIKHVCYKNYSRRRVMPDWDTITK